MRHIVLVARQVWVLLNRKRRLAAQGLVEYALMLVLIAVVVIGALSLVGEANKDRMDNVACQVGEAGTGDPSNCPNP